MMNIFEKGLRTYLNEDQIRAIQAEHVGIGGAGGLGSNCAMILARTGFKHFEIIDQDVIEPSNLNRQQFFYDEVGLPKVDCLRERLKAINPDISLKTRQVRWNESNADEFFNGCRIVVEAFDRADFKFRFVEYYMPRREYVVSGSGMAGLLEKKPMKIRRVANLFVAGDQSTDSAKGHPPMAPRVTACAAMMAEVVLDLALEH